MTYEQFCAQELGYQTKTTFFSDFSIAERFGVAAVKDTFKRAFKEWHNNVEYVTELCMVLNHKCNFLYKSKPGLSKVYADLFYKLDDWCIENLKGDDLSYFYRTTD